MTSEDCSGCTACQSICQHQAINFNEDSEGFKIPIVDNNICVECGLCLKVCPSLNINDKKSNFEQKSYAFQYLDNKRYNSASGGLFIAFAEYFVNKLNGYVCGCVLTDELVPVHIVSNKINDIIRMQDSKYVQSNMNDCFKQIAELLSSQTYVLFTGTSCQVQGLLSSLNKKHIETRTLLTVDFFCHGVPSQKVWLDYTLYVERKTKTKFQGFRFRCKDYGWGKGAKSRNANFYSKFKTKGGYKDSSRLLTRIWPRIFFSNLCIRKYCHKCPYASVNKPADLTMGDFWGIETVIPGFSDGKGCSLALVNNQIVDDIINNMPNSRICRADISGIINKQTNALSPSKSNPNRDEFWSDYSKHTFDFILKKYFDYTFKGIIKSYIKYILFKMHILKYNY